ncbi:MAG: cupin domain-containing protein [Allomuricauda sp.]
MITSKENSEHYFWGDKCSGWHLLKTESLSIIEELMPPNTREKEHYHQHAQQFFRILKGTATFEIANELVQVPAGSGIHIPSGTIHRIRNDQLENLEFLVISEPNTRGDRIEDPS